MTEFEARSRWSMAVRCERMGAYALRGAEPAEPDDLLEGFFRRGKQLEDDVALSFVAEHGPSNVVRHKAIPWPAGIAHGDIFVKPLKLAVEVKSAADPRPVDYHLTQLAGQVEFDEDAEQGALIVVNPSNLRRHVYPMPVVPDELRERVHEIASAVARAADPLAALPDRVCSRPSDAMNRLCPFAGVCFADWEAPDPIEIEGDVARLVAEHADLDDEVKQAKAAAKDAEERRDVVRADLAKTIEPAREYLNRADELVVRRTPVAGRVTWDVQLAAEMGVLGPADIARLEPFRRVGRGYDRWTVKPAHLLDGEEQDAARTLAGLLDFGDAPFHGDERDAA